MSNFISISEVVSTAFERSVSQALVPEIYITIAEQSHLRPALGDDFFERLDTTTGLTAYETALKALIKPALAYWVKFEVLPHIGIQVTNGGLKLADAYNSQNVSAAERRDVRSASLDAAKKLFAIAVRYMEDNASNLPYYTAQSLASRTTSSDGGIIFRR